MSETNTNEQGHIKKINGVLENNLAKLWRFVCNMWKLAKEDDALAKTPGITYRFIMGFIPFLIFLVNAILFVTAVNLDAVLEMVYVYFPERMALTLSDDIKRIVAQQNNLWMWISLMISSYEFTFGLAILVRSTDVKGYAASDENTPIVTFNNKSFTIPFTKNDFIIFSKAFIFNILLTITIIVALGVIVFGGTAADLINRYFPVSSVLLDGWFAVTYIIPFIFMALFLMLFYLFAPTKNTPTIRHAIVAAVFVTSSWIISTVIYRFLLMLIPGIGESYGPLFGLFIMFIWLSFISRFIMAGIYIIKSWEEFPANNENSLK